MFQIIVKRFADNSSLNLKLSKIQLSKIVHPGGFLDRLIGLLLKCSFSLKKIVLRRLVKSVLMPFGLEQQHQ